MGLLEKAKKKKDVKTTDKKESGLSLYKHYKKQVKKEEKKGLKKPIIGLSSKGVKVSRPEGSSRKIPPEIKISQPLSHPVEEVFNKIPQKKKVLKKDLPIKKHKKSGKIDLKEIKKEIEQELRRGSTEKFNPTKISSNRIQTGINGLDEVMSGGLRKNTINLVVGGPGSGKSTFAMQYLIKGIEDYDEPGIYISFEQKEKDIILDFEHYNWNIDDKIKNKKLVILTYTPQQIQKVLDKGGGIVRDIIEDIGAKRIVIDSLTAFTLLHKDALSKRKSCIDLFESIKKWKCTALLVAEQEPDPEKRNPSVEEFEVDGVILLYNIRRGDVRERALEIFKMRGTKHSAKLFPLFLGEDGIIIYPDQTVF